MTTPSGETKGLQHVLEERRFQVLKLQAKCVPVCLFESQNCCMAHLLSQQDNFIDQESMLEMMIREQGHLCIFLPKFHCELNPIEMVSNHLNILTRNYVILSSSTGDGVNIVIVSNPRPTLRKQRNMQSNVLTLVHLMLFDSSSIRHGGLFTPIERVSLGWLQHGLCGNRRVISLSLKAQ